MKKMLYISDVNPDEPIFHSQVLPHVGEMKKFFSVTLLVLSRRKLNVPAHFFPSIPGDYVYTVFMLNFFIKYKFLASVFKGDKYDVIYSRGTRGGLLGIFIKKYIFRYSTIFLNDVRADVLDEHKDSFIRRSAFRFSNQRIFDQCDIIFFVSHFLKHKYQDVFNIKPLRLYVYPTFVPDDKFLFSQVSRDSLRLSLGYNDSDIVVLYSGNLAKWQNFEFILQSFCLAKNRRLRLLVLTRDSRIVEYLRKYSLIDSSTVKWFNVTYDEIGKYYFAADYGILIRDDIDTNKSASPTKFSEYVNSGLQLIINKIDADYVRQFKDYDLKGVVLTNKNKLIECFDSLGKTDLPKGRNRVRINTLSDIVKSQVKAILSII